MGSASAGVPTARSEPLAEGSAGGGIGKGALPVCSMLLTISDASYACVGVYT